ncbi:MAG: T9SS type A sorting domain-containing protein [Ignavibacteriae bacterium]|nr:T9SS type A sorting domain-containing protein [Ignavibacteriota bacterium]
MKNILLILVFPLLLGNAISQVSPPVRLTNGNDDRNASFGIIYSWIDFGFQDFEFMIFERHSEGASQICISKIGHQGAIDSVTYLTNDMFLNTNPVIEYNKPGYPNNGIIHTAFAVWQSNKFGRESIFGSTFRISSGWTEPFIIDSSNSNNRNPVLTGIDSGNYMIVYESDNDIKFKKFNFFTHETIAEGNLTMLVPEVCSNPRVYGSSESVLISYDKEISPVHKAVFYRTGPPDLIPLNENPGDTIVYSGINHCLGFGRQSLLLNPIIETNRNGNTDIFTVQLFPLYFINPVVVDSSFDNLNYKGTDIVITDNVTNLIYSYLRRSDADLRILYGEFFNPEVLNLKISDDPFFKSTLGISNGVRIPDEPCQKFWFVYNKDSADSGYPSTIYGISYTNCLTEIHQNNLSLTENFFLTQNYPNPFNPETHLEFGIPELGFVSLKIYDVLGNEVAALVNETKQAGSYSLEWNATNFPSGIYFYKLTSGNFSEVKRMMLLK